MGQRDCGYTPRARAGAPRRTKENDNCLTGRGWIFAHACPTMSYKNHVQRSAATIAIVTLVSAMSACGGAAKLPVEAGMGPRPELPPPRTSMFPVVSVATAKGWQNGAKPTAAPGLAVVAFADKLEHPRALYVLPNGDVLVAETNGPPRPEDEPGGIRGWFMKRYF